jgi:DNA replication protein DnaD
MAEEDLYQERWETDLLKAEDVAEVALLDMKEEERPGESPIRKLEGDENVITAGLLAKLGHLIPESYEFVNLWLKFIVIKRTTDQLEEALLKGSDEIDEQILNIFDSTPCLASSGVSNLADEKRKDVLANLSSIELQSELIQM